MKVKNLIRILQELDPEIELAVPIADTLNTGSQKIRVTTFIKENTVLPYRYFLQGMVGDDCGEVEKPHRVDIQLPVKVR